MYMHAPQIIWLVLTVMAVGLIATRHGEPIAEKYTFGGMAFVSALLSILYYWGGFFDTFGLPQGVLVACYALTAGIHAAKDGEPRTGNYNIFTSLLATAGYTGLLYLGGFFG